MQFPTHTFIIVPEYPPNHKSCVDTTDKEKLQTASAQKSKGTNLIQLSWDANVLNIKKKTK